MDHRVAEEREQAMLESGFLDEGMSATAFVNAKANYFREFLCKPVSNQNTSAHGPVYLSDFNKNNLIPEDNLSPNNRLIHIASISVLLSRALSGSAASADLELFLEDVVGERPPAEINNETIAPIIDGLRKKGEAAIKDFAGVLSEALGPTEPHWWAAFSYEVEPYLQDEDWTQAARVLGLGHLTQGDWLMAWRYPLDLTGALYRPTVVETADNGFHFPSPPDSIFGIAMPLGENMPAVREVIHAPLKADESVEGCWGRIGRIIGPIVDIENDTELREWFQLRRNAHRNYFTQFPINGKTQHWIERHLGSA